MTKQTAPFYIIVILSSFIISSCASIKRLEHSVDADKSYCNYQLNYDYTVGKMPTPLHEMQLDTELSKHFTYRSLNVANAIGIINLLEDFLHAKNKIANDSSIENRIKLIEISQQLDKKINIASLEISSTGSELSCEEERAKQIGNFLKDIEDNREQKLVIGSIIIGAAGSIVAGSMALNKGNENAIEYIGIGTSAVEASLGVLMLVNKQKVYFYHNRNSLSEIWNATPTSSTLSPAIWYFLNYANPNKNEKSLRALLIEKWLRFGQVTKDSENKESEDNQLYFGKGGRYNVEQLQNRANMYDQLEAYITIMKQDLMKLSQEIEAYI